MASPKNGAVVAEKTKRREIPKRIRKHINEAFAAHAASGDQSHRDAVEAAKKEVLAELNGLYKQLHP